jgi:type I restriction enzyme S subunit
MRQYPAYKDSGINWIGKIPENWKVNRLKTIAILTYGDSLANEDRIEGNIPVYGSNGIVGYHNKAITNKPCIIIGRKGSYGKVNFSQTECFPIDTTYFIDEDSAKCDLRWLNYILPLLELDKFSKDTGVPGLNRVDAHDKKIPIPEINSQKRIVDFLDHKTELIDDLITKKERMIELLKEEWEAVINQAVTKGLDPTVEMKDSGIDWLGNIPKHWDIVPLTKYLESIADYRGKTPSKNEIGGVFLVTARNIKGGIIDYSLSQEFVDLNEYAMIMSRGLPKIGDVLLTMEAPLGEVANVDKEDIALAQRVIKLRGKKGIIDNYFLKYWMMSTSFQNHLQSLATGSTALGIKASKLNLLRFVIPPFAEQMEIVKSINNENRNIERIIEKYIQEIDLLQEYRTSLISDVVTGKIDIRN